LRRSFCTNLIKSGCNIKVIQKMMGHKSIITTSGYIFFDEEEMLDEFKKAFKNLDI
jgi:site-specific recombinase XerD